MNNPFGAIRCQQLPNVMYAPTTAVSCEDCGWSGTVADCKIKWDSEGYEYPEYRITVCPECSSEVTI